MSPEETVRALLDARAAHDAAQIAELLDDELVWVTPKGATYDRAAIEPTLSEQESHGELEFARELRHVEAVDGERVLALYDHVYTWVEDGLENRVPAGGIFRVRDGRIVEARTFLSAEKAREAAGA
jgi:ketosteroid isomerase-like protein